MLQISARTDYGILLMLSLAERYGDGRTPLRAIASEKRLPYRFLGSIALSLKRAGLVAAHEGASGGYALQRHPSRISVGDVIRALEGAGPVARCMTEAGTCPKLATCTLPPLWSRVTQRMYAAFDRLTLAALLRDPRRVPIRL